MPYQINSEGDFLLEKEYQRFLHNLGLNESQMSDKQAQAMKVTFYAGLTSMYTMMEQTASMPTPAASYVLMVLEEQLKVFWKKEHKGAEAAALKKV